MFIHCLANLDVKLTLFMSRDLNKNRPCDVYCIAIKTPHAEFKTIEQVRNLIEESSHNIEYVACKKTDIIPGSTRLFNFQFSQGNRKAQIIKVILFFDYKHTTDPIIVELKQFKENAMVNIVKSGGGARVEVNY